MNSLKRYIVGCLFVGSILFASCTRDLDVSQPNTPIGNFLALKEIIDTKYCFVEEKGVDWAKICDEYEIKVQDLSEKDERELFDLFAAMLDSLHDGHVNLYSPFDVSRSRSWYENYPRLYISSIVYGDKYLTKDYKIAGGLNYNLIAEGTVGLIRYESFSSYFSTENIYYIWQYFKNCNGLIVDVRGNGGGDLEYAYRLASLFFKETRVVGYWHHKTGSGHNDYSELEEIKIDTAAMKAKWFRPVVVLCDRQSYSATNSFVNAMRYADNCLIVGGLTGGGGGMPMTYELPNGWLVRFSSIKMYDAQKISIEEGIEPDVSMLQKSDSQDDLIEYAVKYINKK